MGLVLRVNFDTDMIMILAEKALHQILKEKTRTILNTDIHLEARRTYICTVTLNGEVERHEVVFLV